MSYVCNSLDWMDGTARNGTYMFYQDALSAELHDLGLSYGKSGNFAEDKKTNSIPVTQEQFQM